MGFGTRVGFGAPECVQQMGVEPELLAQAGNAVSAPLANPTLTLLAQAGNAVSAPLANPSVSLTVS